MIEVTFKSFLDEYQDNLKQPSCIPTCMEEICGGWSQETFKQNIQKITKKGTNPLPLWFDSPESMDGISNKLGSLQECFKVMDVRKKNRIDAYELFAVMLLMVEGAFETKLGNIIEIFGGEQPNAITQGEMHWFLDALFRGLFKILIKKGETAPKDTNRRISDEEIKGLLKLIFKDLNSVRYVMKDEMVRNMETSGFTLFNFLDKTQTAMEKSLKNAREQAILNMRISVEVKRKLYEMIMQIEKQAKEKK